MKVLKKNQVIIFVVALMLVVAGYFNYTVQNKEVAAVSNEVSEIGDAKLVSSSDMVAGKEEINNIIEEANQEVQETNSNLEEQKNQTQTGTNTMSNDYFTNSRISRDTMYSQMIETYQKVLENASVSEAQKSISSQEIVKINETKNAIMITENLIKSKGIEDVVILVNDPSVNVIVKGENLAQEQIAQIQNIVSREMKTEIENIHISNQ